MSRCSDALCRGWSDVVVFQITHGFRTVSPRECFCTRVCSAHARRGNAAAQVCVLCFVLCANLTDIDRRSIHTRPTSSASPLYALLRLATLLPAVGRTDEAPFPTCGQVPWLVAPVAEFDDE